MSLILISHTDNSVLSYYNTDVATLLLTVCYINVERLTQYHVLIVVILTAIG